MRREMQDGESASQFLQRALARIAAHQGPGVGKQGGHTHRLDLRIRQVVTGFAEVRITQRQQLAGLDRMIASQIDQRAGAGNEPEAEPVEQKLIPIVERDERQIVQHAVGRDDEGVAFEIRRQRTHDTFVKRAADFSDMRIAPFDGRLKGAHLFVQTSGR